MKPTFKKTAFTNEELLEQKNKICSNNELSSKSILCRLLSYLVNETISGREEKLKGYTIAVELFHKEDDFDGEQNPLVRIHAGRLRRALSNYYLRDGKNDPIRIEIPKGQYVPKIFTNKRALDIENAEESGTEKLIKPTIAILPFLNHSGDSTHDYFSLGFSEELSVELIKFEDLIVFESMSFLGGSNADKHEGLLEKGIRFIVEGGVQLTNKQIKVLVRLTDLTRKEQIWAERYIRDLAAASLIEIQEDIVKEISGIIGSEYGIILQRLSGELIHQKPKYLDTFHAISRFYYFEATQTPEAFINAFEALESTLITEPESGIAHAMLAVLYGNRYMLDIQNPKEALLQINELSDKALDLEPNSSIVRVVNAWRFFLNNDRSRFIQETEYSLSKDLHPSSRLGALGLYLSLYGEWDRGKSILDKVIQSGISFPLYYYGGTVLYYYRKKEYEKALAEALHYDIPALFWGPLLRVAVLGQLNKTSEAKANIDHLKLLKPDFESKAPYLISLCVKENELVEHIMEGLRRAGMQV